MGHKSKKIFVAGYKGLAGSAIIRRLEKEGFENLLCVSRDELDLDDFTSVMRFFEKERPEWVFLAAAKVGGIYANSTYPADFILDNLKIQNNVIEASHRYGVGKLLFLGSSCIYPKLAPQPLKEAHLLSSQLEPSNEAYAVAKIAGIKLCNAFNKQYGTNYLCVMPTNLYGINDNYHVENAHVVPMLMRRFHEAKIAKAPRVVVWGTGTPLREFMCSDDLADACVFLMDKYNAGQIGELINIGTGKEQTIAETVAVIKEVVGYQGEIVYDRNKPDGTPRKVLDVSRMKALGWTAKVSFREGLVVAYDDFLNNPRTRLGA